MQLCKPLDSIEEMDLQSLIDNKVSEGKTLDYKELLPGRSDADKKEFLADVSSFANASGGHLIYGIRENSGVPTEMLGIVCNPDDEINRLENIIRDGIEPRIPGIQMRSISVLTSKYAIMIWIPRSWALPHRVKFQKDLNFYSRNSAGKYPLDVSELRSLFALSETTAERIRNFRAERLSKIIAAETPALLEETPKTILHIVPFTAFDPAIRFDVSSLFNILIELRPIQAQGWNYRHNFDGFLTYCSGYGSSLVYSYLQFFRNGSVEALVTILPPIEDKKRLIINVAFENELLACLSRYLSIQKNLGVEPPIVVMLTILGVNGYTMVARTSQHFSGNIYPITTDALVMPEVIVETFDANPADSMKPVFDTIWNAAGLPRSFGYDGSGERMV